MLRKKILNTFILLIIIIVVMYGYLLNDINKTGMSTITIIPGEKIITYGFADMGNMKYGNGNFVVIDDEKYPDMKYKTEVFTNAVKGNNFVILSGDIDLSKGKINDYDHGYFDEFNDDNTPKHEKFVANIGSNTTLIGLKNARIKYGELLLSDVENIIIQNITFYDAHGSPEKNPKTNINAKCSCDNISVEKVKNLWIDHCSFTDGKCIDVHGNYHDGLIDIKSGTNITISYCYFTNHSKVMLLTPSDDFADKTNVYLTLHHNCFDKIIQRTPRARWATVHIYNNYYENIGNRKINFGYSLGPGIGCKFIVENNYFGFHQSGIVNWYDKSNINDESCAVLYYQGNFPELKNRNSKYSEIDKLKNYKLHVKKEKIYDIPYYYQLESVRKIKKELINFAGANKKIQIYKYQDKN